MHYIYICLLSLFCSLSISGQINFEERSLRYNVIHQMHEWSVGCGISVFDFNQDGRDDLSFGTEAGREIGFYINMGSRFEKVSLVNNLELVKQILWADYDNDGDPDLYVAAFDGVNRLYKNKGDLTFAEITEFSGLPLETHRGYGAIFGDYNRDGWLDLYYVSRDIPGSENFQNQNRLFENLADGTFIEVTEQANAADAGKVPFCAGFIDYNNDMWPDIYIANDKYSQNALLENNQSGGFRDNAAASKSDFRMNAMCVNAEDYNNDGWTDLYITNTTEGSICLRNSGATSSGGLIEFSDVADTLAITYKGNTGWGSLFVDVDNDADLDLFVSGSVHDGAAPEVKGSSIAFFENINAGLSFEQPNIPSLQKDTTFSYANAFGDLNGDGLPDIIVQNNMPDRFFIWENLSSRKNNFLKVKLTGVKSNKDGIGTRIECYADSVYQTKYTRCGSSFLGQSSATKIFGLSNASQVDSLVITWSSGHIDKLYDLEINQQLEIVEGSSTENEINLAPDIIIKEGEIKTNTLERSVANKIILYPNPSKDQIFISSPVSLSYITILDYTGKAVLKQAINESKSVGLHIDHLRQGLYLVKLTTPENKNATMRWIKL